MNYSIPWLQQQIDSGQPVKYIFFWGHQPHPKGIITSTCMSQWWESPFTVDGITYATAEHWMMAEKARLFGDTAIAEKIIACKKPGEAKALGRTVQNFDNATWEAKRFEIVCEGNVHKFGQNATLKDYLLQTGDRVLVEASPVDFIWGIGLTGDKPEAMNPAKWRGLNLLGFALMEVRDRLRSTL